ncbi:MAG: MarR family transcriptional regulator [Ahrensia sp.]|jgi:MarR family transcriptional regulator for hemolysin|nr:MarR family transcriptional regulator [Ahrensia sp.]MAZ16333.1 MarR family transcriptional regulator [Ahrensia sp.]|tara:strand:+ start:2143 stop:2589 length:447 start_codon:yes stop_codon:yes gene_type:complete
MTVAPDLAETFTRTLASVSRQWKRRLDAQFRHLGLSQARWGVILELSRHEDATQIELARVLGIEGATLVRLLDGLEAIGLVERHPSPEDRRAKKLALTEPAKMLLEKMKTIAARNRTEILEDVPADDLRTAVRVLGLIASRLETMENG